MKSDLGKLGAVEAAQRAAQSGIVSFVDEREQAVIDRAVSEFRGGTLDGVKALTAIGIISELRLARDAAKRAINEGRAAGEALTR